METKRNVLLITENPDSDFSKKICKATILSGHNIVIDEPTFKALSIVLKKQIGVVVLNSEEMPQLSDYFFKAIRIFHSQTPIIFSTPSRVLFDTVGTQKFDKHMSVEDWTSLIADAFEFDREYTLSSLEISKRVDQNRNLTGDQLTDALDKARSETFGKMKFATPKPDPEVPIQ